MDTKTWQRASGSPAGVTFVPIVAPQSMPGHQTPSEPGEGARTEYPEGESSWPGGILTALAGMYMFQSI